MTTVGSTDDRIDSLDVISDIEELQDELEHERNVIRREELTQELETLEAFADQGRAFDDWPHGLLFIHEDFFTEYVEESYQDIYGNVPDALANHIDWEGVADDWREDYSEVEFDGQTYLTR